MFDFFTHNLGLLSSIEKKDKTPPVKDTAVTQFSGPCAEVAEFGTWGHL